MQITDLTNPLALTLALTGVVFVLIGIISFKKPPGKRNWIYGYRTAASMRSPERWKYAQRESARASIQAGAALMVLAIPAWFWWPVPAYGLFLGMIALVAAVVYIFWKVQGRLKRRFGP